MAIVVERVQNTEDGFVEVMQLLLELYREGAYAPLDLDRLSEDTFAVLTHDMTFIARDDDGKALGLIGLVEEEFYYSPQTYLASKWIYVRNAHRKHGVLNALLKACKEEAETKNLMLFIQIDNPDRKPKKTKTGIEMQTLGYVPHGYILKMKAMKP